MKHGIIILLTILTLGANAQQRSANQYLEGFRDGLIVTQANDTIICQVPVAINFGDKVSIKRIAGGPTEVIPLSNIKYLATATNVYENIGFQTAENTMNKLMWLEVEGPLNLYLEISRIEGASNTVVLDKSRHNPGGGTKTYINFTESRIYVIRKGTNTYLIPKENFGAYVKPLVIDIPELTAKVDAKVYKYENIEELVKEYNRLKQ